MLTLSGARIASSGRSQVEIALARGFRLTIFFLDTHLARVLITPPQGLRMPRTWSLSPERKGDDPIDGRDRLDLAGFSLDAIQAITETDASVTIETALIKAEVRPSPLA